VIDDAMFMQRLSRRHAFTVLAWLALLICLVSVSSVHHHKDGVHLLHACQLCSLEDITSHGSAVSLTVLPVMGQNIETEDLVLHPRPLQNRFSIINIRGSPATS